MFELSDTLVGIYKVSDCTQQCTIKNNTAEGQHQKNISSQRSRITQNDQTLNDNFVRPSQPVRQLQKRLSIIDQSIDNSIDQSIDKTITDVTMDTEITSDLEEENLIPSVVNTVDDALEVSKIISDETQNSDSTMDTSFDEPPVVMTVTAQINSNNN